MPHFHTLAAFLEMGGYAIYVWPAFLFTAIVLIWNVFYPLHRHRSLRMALRKKYEAPS